MRVETLPDGLAICADSTKLATIARVRELVGAEISLIIADPPYGNIVDEEWDRINESDEEFCSWMIEWTNAWVALLAQGAAMYVWGGVGKPGFRPFFRYLSWVERRTPLQLADLITWSKKRAYGTPTRLLFCREECAYLVLGDPKKPRQFNIPYLGKLRGYEGYNKKYPAKSPYLRRTNVWTDISEIFRGKLHPTQKPERLAEIMIETHTSVGEWVVDPFAGSGSVAHAARRLGRRFLVIEKDPEIFSGMLARLT